MVQEWFGPALKVAITCWLVAIAVWDHLSRRVPNWLVLPVMGGAMVYQVYLFVVDRTASGLGFALVAWVVLLLLWQMRIFGGGDAKLLMALFALFPTVQFLIFFSLVVLVVSLPLLVYQLVKRRGVSLLAGLRERARTGQWLPTDRELQVRGRPYCWTLALPGVIYLWWLW